MDTQVLPPSPVSAPRKVSGWGIVGLVIAGLFILGLVGNALDTAPEAGRTSTISDPVTIGEPAGLVSYDGVTVDEMVAFSIGTPEWETICTLTPTVGYEASRQMYLDAEPQIGSDAYEGAVFDGVMAAC